MQHQEQLQKELADWQSAQAFVRDLDQKVLDLSLALDDQSVCCYKLRSHASGIGSNTRSN